MNALSHAQSQVIDRHYGLDWLRICAFLLLIFHHIGRAFVSGDWLVKLDEIDWLNIPMLLVTPWRLAVLFVIAGFASRAMLSRLGTSRFARERTLRLLVPLLAAMILIIPPQSYVNIAFNHDYHGTFGHFLATEAYGFAGYDGVPQPGWEHLWFVFYLWAYTMLLVGGIMLAPQGLKDRLTGWIAALLHGRRLLWLPLLYFIPARVGVAFTLGESHGLFDDWVSDVVYLPCFLIGFAVAGSRGLWPAVARAWPGGLALAFASYSVLVVVESRFPGDQMMPHFFAALDRAAMAAMMWGMVITLLHAANTVLNRDHPWRTRLSEAVFPFYIIHQTIIVVLAWSLLTKGLSTGADFIVLFCGTVSGCWLFYRLGDLVPGIRPLIGLKPRVRSPQQTVPAAAA